MIIFDLTALADDSHRRHLIDPEKDPKAWRYANNDWRLLDKYGSPCTEKKWQANYAAYYEACEGDAVIAPVLEIYNSLDSSEMGIIADIEIWTSECQSARHKIISWFVGNEIYIGNHVLKLRPIGDDRPQEQLFEEWVNDSCIETKWGHKDNIEMVFSSHGPTIDMFRARGVFVFDCNQGK